MDLRTSSFISQVDNVIAFMIRDIAIYTGQTEEDVAEEYHYIANPSISRQVLDELAGKEKYPLTTMLGQMLRKKHTEGRFTIEMLMKEKERCNEQSTI